MSDVSLDPLEANAIVVEVDDNEAERFLEEMKARSRKTEADRAFIAALEAARTGNSKP